MTVVGFGYNKIHVERDEKVKAKIQINNNVLLTNVEKTPLEFGSESQDVLKFDFEFSTKYEPKKGEITLTGYLLYMADSETVEKVADEWSKEQKLPQDLLHAVLNNVLRRCNVQALLLSKEINLPPNLPMPRVTTKVQKSGGEEEVALPNED